VAFIRRTSAGEKGGPRGLLQNVQVEHELPNLLLEFLDVLVLERLLILGARPQRVFRPEKKSLSPLLDLRDGQPVLPGRGLR
jgi:hypothetical protein